MTLVRPLIRYLDRKILGIRRRWQRASLPDFAIPVKNLTFETPRKIVNPKSIHIGSHSYIGPNSSLTACGEVGPPFVSQKFDGRISIGARFWATHGLQIFAAQLVEIADDVMIAGNVFICDCQHGYASAEIPYKQQIFFPVKPIKIGAGVWIGQNVVIMPGVEIGAQAIIGANSVVTHSFPEKVIAAGSPARIIKQYDTVARQWVSMKNATTS